MTGLGVVSPIGTSRERFWRAALEGRSGARRLDSPWIVETGLLTRIGCPVDAYEVADAGIEPRLARVVDRATMFALGAAREAIEDAGLDLEPDPDGRDGRRIAGVDPFRVATVVGSGIGGIGTIESTHATWRAKRSREAIRRFALPMLIPNAPAGQVAIRFGARGECKAVATACAAGTMAIGEAWRLLRDGDADVVLAGGAENVVGDEDAYALMGFDRLQTLSTRNDEPGRASRPFDLHRDGFVLGEGAAILCLEREEHARARGARVFACIEGYASNCDARSMLQLDETGETIVALMRAALRSADLGRDDVDAISPHGTSTRQNDRTEARALRALFGARCDGMPVSALKSMTGHAIAASGPMETAAAALALHEQRLAPTLNYETPDPECDVDVVAGGPREARLRAVLKLSYGFGGHNACLVLTRATR